MEVNVDLRTQSRKEGICLRRRAYFSDIRLPFPGAKEVK